MPGTARVAAATQPGGVRTLMPSPLSSTTISSGSGRRWNAQYAAVLTAPAAVEWFTDASPRLATTIASAGQPVRWPSRAARSRAKASPMARGRCEAMVEVCGITFSARLPEYLVPAARDRLGGRGHQAEQHVPYAVPRRAGLAAREPGRTPRTGSAAGPGR